MRIQERKTSSSRRESQFRPNNWVIGSKNRAAGQERKASDGNTYATPVSMEGERPLSPNERQPIRLIYRDLSRSEKRIYAGHGGKRSRKRHILGESATLRIHKLHKRGRKSRY